MAMTAVGSDHLEPPGTPGCWCCGDRNVQASLLRLGEHPEVGVCFRCVKVLARRKRTVERQTRSAPAGWPLWRGAVPCRVRSLLMEITCADCGCLVDRGVIVRPCDTHPDCCCRDLPVREQGDTD